MPLLLVNFKILRTGMPGCHILTTRCIYKGKRKYFLDSGVAIFRILRHQIAAVGWKPYRKLVSPQRVFQSAHVPCFFPCVSLLLSPCPLSLALLPTPPHFPISFVSHLYHSPWHPKPDGIWNWSHILITFCICRIVFKTGT